jgi:uncharacterized protein Yka (UPF0111/DUF47 family)
MIEQLVEKVFAARNEAHIAHWATKSFAEHMALNEFYDNIIDLIDKLVEAYQGCYGLIEVTQLEADLKKPVLYWLNEDVKWIAENREEIAGGVRSLENLIDEISDQYLSTIYKLENLS